MSDSNRLPLPQFKNLFEEDSFGQKFFRHFFGKEIFEKYKSQFEAMGEAGAKATPFSKEADLNEPELISFDEQGLRVDKIKYHHSHQILEELSYGKGIVSKKYQSPMIDKDRSYRHQLGFAIGSYFAQTETGIFCPICMTDALGYVLEKHEQSPEVKEVLKHLAAEKLKDQWQGAMFLTEIQGGSDVGANILRSEQTKDGWKIFGEKWFCSNVDAQAALVLARLPGEEGDLKHGTKGLGLFLLLRETPKENWRNWQVNRLKSKLGVRSMASGEVVFNGAYVHLLAGFGKGFKMMAEMVNMSRLYNSVSSISIARRSLLEALYFGKARTAFGKTLSELPLWRSSYSDLVSEYVLLHTLLFQTIRALDKGECGDEASHKVARALTPICKAITGKFSVHASAEAMELIGGNAYIEDHILPRLMRDAQVLPIWEGTTHIQSLDLLRSLKKEGAEALFARLTACLKDSKGVGHQQLQKLQKELAEYLKDLSLRDVSSQQRLAREAVEKLARVASLSFVYELGRESAELRELCEATMKRQIDRKFFCTGPSAQAPPFAFEEESIFLTL